MSEDEDSVLGDGNANKKMALELEEQLTSVVGGG